MRLTHLIAASLSATAAMASEDIADKYPQSELYDKPVEVIPHVFSAIGATAPPTYENAGHNNNLSFIVTGDGVVVINGGASARLAAALHDEIKAVTDQPVKLVINENGQGHAVLGNSYWADLGIDILAHEDAIAVIEADGLWRTTPQPMDDGAATPVPSHIRSSIFIAMQPDRMDRVPDLHCIF